jgi:ABC-2 type transport system ATP-binding protein
MLVVKNLTKIFSGLKAVDNVSFELERGRIYAFVGPNGAGKTTTMRMIATLEEPTAGEIHVNGLSVYEHPYAIRRLLGYMPDHYGTYPDMTTRDYLEFYARAYELERGQRPSRVEAIMEFTGLNKLNGKKVETLSKGQRQRLNLGRALVNDPDLLILDEPAAGLDPRARVELRYLMLQLAEQGKTLFVSSHILSELAEISSEMLIIDKGKLVHFGSVSQIQEQMQQALEISVKVLGDAEAVQRLERLLLERPNVADIRVLEGETVNFTFHEPQEAVSRLLRDIVRQEIPVIEFKTLAMTMEDVFMQITGSDME